MDKDIHCVYINTAVLAKNVYVTYQQQLSEFLILKNFNLSVKTGTIYGLLGPSGCGKTTFLRCLTGFRSLSFGSILIFGYPPGEPKSGIPGRGLGYMPQDVALQEYLTIEEILTYFANIYRLNDDIIKERIDELLDIYDINNKNALICTLSGGQKRRVSLALSIINKPRLLVLDEPTVGCDPILRSRIWNLLIKYSQKYKTTIILTTHYIEEAKKSDTIGLMREGTLLIEGSPKELMEKMRVNTIEKIFFKVCCASEESTISLTSSTPLSSTSSSSIPKVIYVCNKYPLKDTVNNFMEKDFLIWYYTLTVVMNKIWLQLKRTPSTYFIQFIIPLLSLMIFSMVIGRSPNNLDFGILNNDLNSNISKLFYKCIDSHALRINEYQSLDEIKKLAKEKKIWGWLEIRKNFSSSIEDRIRFSDYANDQQILASNLIIHGDVSIWPLKITIERSFEIAYMCFLKKYLNSMNKNTMIASMPFSLEKPIYGKYSNNDYTGFREFVIIGIIIIVTYSVSFAITFFVIIQEKLSNIFERHYASGVTSTQLLLGHLITRMFIQISTTIPLFLISVFLFECPLNGSIVYALILLLLNSLTGCTHGLFFSALAFDYIYASLICSGVLITLFITGGVLWSYEAMPYFVKWFIKIFPICLPCESLRSVLVRGWDLGHPTVLSGVLISISWSIIFLYGAIKLFKYSNGTPTIKNYIRYFMDIKTD